MGLAPDITILPNDGYETWNYRPRGWTGVHKREGVFLACGPGIKRGVEIQGARIYDLAPTILHVLGAPMPRDMDGSVLREIFEQDSVLARRDTEYQEADETARIAKKIRDLKTGGKI